METQAGLGAGQLEQALPPLRGARLSGSETLDLDGTPHTSLSSLPSIPQAYPTTPDPRFKPLCSYL